MKFKTSHKKYFNAIDGAYSKVTRREIQDSQITLDSDESEIAIQFWGTENIYTGNVQSNPALARQIFWVYPTNEQIELNLVFPKLDKSELRLYLKAHNFKPTPDQIWFIFISQDKKPYLGAMDEVEWTKISELSNEHKIHQNSQITNEGNNHLTKQSELFSIRPAGRHILTIGRDLIQDQYAAIVELVKNAYDADSPDVHISFNIPKGQDKITITVEDHGHGMDRNTVITKWLVPSTSDKLKRRRSPNGRVMQGRKGVGRYATSFLGSDLLLETVTDSGEKTEVYVNWNEFDKAEYLDDVPVIVNSSKTTEPAGTRLTITGNNIYTQNADNQNYVLDWILGNKKQGMTPIDTLQRELKKLIPPIDPTLFHEDIGNEFSIFLTVNGFFSKGEEHRTTKIEPYQIFDLFDYRISGIVESDGSNTLTFENQRARNTTKEILKIDVGNASDCGKLVFDLRVYDLDKDAIDQLVQRGQKDNKNNHLGKQDARQLLKTYNGIGVYRGGFRLRPLGDADFDWLELNKKRIQNPGLRIGSDRVIGYVQIQAEEQSGLEEKSARDGLRENIAYQRLKEITSLVISEIEKRRYIFLQKTGLRKSVAKIERDLDKIFDLGGLKAKVEQKLIAAGVNDSVRLNILNTIVDQQTESNEIVEDIRQAVAIYQGQATLGKIVNVVLHEGRKPLDFLRSQSDNIGFWLNHYKKKLDQDSLDEAISLASQFGVNTKILSDLFSRIDPLAARRRGNRTRFKLKDCIDTSLLVFEDTLISNHIYKDVYCDELIYFFGWPADIQIILTNLIENSIYWMIEKNSNTRKIVIHVKNHGSEFLHLDYRDTGPGIEPSLIETEIIFDPEFSTKPDGTGLGLAIAGESALRNGLELKALESDSGVHFRLSLKEEDQNELS